MKPCPCCGNSHEVYCNEDGRYVHCGGCGLSTKDYDSQEEARTAWNRRTPPASAQSEAKPVAWLSSFIHQNPDPHWRRIYTAHTSEKRARDYVSDLIDPKVEPLYPAPLSATDVRDAALEEAAQLCDKFNFGTRWVAAENIRLLKSKKGA
nr:Lar family restriction alleviation protein [Robbsia andropogonis]